MKLTPTGTSQTLRASRPSSGSSGDYLYRSSERCREERIRLAIIAAETGARFVRERIETSPIDWLLAPHRLFDGEAAIDACRCAEGFRRAVVLHGLSIGLDAAPGLVAGISTAMFLGAEPGIASNTVPPGSSRSDTLPFEDPELYTCTISALAGGQHIQVFAAMIASGPEEVRRRLRQRYGPLLEDEAIVRSGFDWSEPLACAMVSDAMAHVLTLASEAPESPIAAGLDFQVEQRFVA